MISQVLFFGGNGHNRARLAPARAALAQLAANGSVQPFELVDLPYPGFEGRPRTATLEEFLSELASQIQPQLRSPVRSTIFYATGIGGLLVLCLRAEGRFVEVPALFQAPVLWGLERRLMPRIMRLGLARLGLQWLFARIFWQRLFVAKYFRKHLTPPERAEFFAGYAQAEAAAEFFSWLTPALLRDLEFKFRAHPEFLERITVWWGSCDQVVNLQELAWTEKALGRRWPVRTIPHWGHYPMIDDPEDWVRTLSHALADPAMFSGCRGSETE